MTENYCHLLNLVGKQSDVGIQCSNIIFCNVIFCILRIKTEQCNSLPQRVIPITKLPNWGCCTAADMFAPCRYHFLAYCRLFLLHVQNIALLFFIFDTTQRYYELRTTFVTMITAPHIDESAGQQNNKYMQLTIRYGL